MPSSTGLGLHIGRRRQLKRVLLGPITLSSDLMLSNKVKVRRIISRKVQQTLKIKHSGQVLRYRFNPQGHKTGTLTRIF